MSGGAEGLSGGAEGLSGAEGASEGVGVGSHPPAVNATWVLTAPVPGSVAGVTAVTVTSDQLSLPSRPANALSTSTSRSPAVTPLTLPASRTDRTDGVPSTGCPNAVCGLGVTGTFDAPVKVAVESTSKVCDGTPGEAVLDRLMPAGMTSGSPGCPAALRAARLPVAAIPGAGS